MPGPGNYNQGSTIGSQGFTMGAKSQTKYNDGPGPGAYNARSDVTKTSMQTSKIA